MKNDKMRIALLDFKKALGICNFCKDLSETEFNLIAIVNEYRENKKNINLTTLSDQLHITRSAVTQIANKLVNKGYIEKYTLESNKKEIYLKIGKKAINQYNLVMDKIATFVEKLSIEVGKEGMENIEKYIEIAKKIGNEMKEESESNA